MNKGRATRFKKLWRWEDDEENFYSAQTIPGDTLHVCCGKSQLGDVRVDIDPELKPDIVADYRNLPIKDNAFSHTICDPPWGKTERLDAGIINWISELRRVTRDKIIIIHNTMFKIKGWKQDLAYSVNAKGIFYKVFQTLVPQDKTIPEFAEEFNMVTSGRECTRGCM